MLVSKIKPCMSQYKLLYGETANGSLKGGCFSLVAEIAMRGRYEWSVSFGRRAIGGRAAGRFVE